MTIKEFILAARKTLKEAEVATVVTLDRSCPHRWCSWRLGAVLSAPGRSDCQRATAGKLIWGSSLI